ncbi:hypothetical protein N7532_011647 [Penicillium argentinense]|uniref:FAD-binding domain-containing protein n=1 Tax=Penicillium argentinense TaxID=1131581 RepID=A0A9W9JUR7_9EURO|nr:uncharacterized protein N7532_011647 [Penicillium argentinense]KAJ5082604.1 hypothetical protein N7532_011647 [Penicillium argentinense]
MYWVLVAHRSKSPSSDQKSWPPSSTEAAELATQLISSWNPYTRTIFEMSDVSQTSIRSLLSAVPAMPPWRPSSRVTLLDDAAHVMPPTGAMGANTALRDAADLARQVVAAGGARNVSREVIGSYESGMRDFVKMAIEMSWRGGMRSFGLRPSGGI